MDSQKHKVEQLQDLLLKTPTIANALGIEVIKMAPESLEAKMPVDERTKQPFGLLHGGASVVLAEGLASLGSCLNIDLEKQQAVGISISANHIRSARNGWVYAKAEPLSLGRKIHVWNINIKDENNKLIATSRCTVAIISN